jgi:hypothetical protein
MNTIVNYHRKGIHVFTKYRESEERDPRINRITYFAKKLAAVHLDDEGELGVIARDLAKTIEIFYKEDYFVKEVA